MNGKLLNFIPLLSVLLLAGCGDSHDKAMRDSISTTKEMVSVLKGIETAEDAKAAKSKIEAIGKRMEKIKKRMEKLGDPSPEAQEALMKKYQKELGEVMSEMMGLTAKMLDPKISKEIGSAMEAINGM